MFGMRKRVQKGTTVTLKIAGMHCPSCAMNIDGELEDTPGVLMSTTSYAKAETKVVFDGERVSLDQIKDTISKVGYVAEKLDK